MAHLSLGMLGSMQVSVADTPVTTLESDKVCALLAYLAVEADHPHRRETLVGLLWPDCPEKEARHNLRQALFNLRLAIGDHSARPPYLLITRDAIQFNRESDYSLDLAEFNTHFYACERNLSQCVEDCSIRAARLEEMVKLYRGEFLQQFFLADSAEFEEWTLVQRETLHQRVLDALTYLVNYYELHTDFYAARRNALRQLELEPWREEAHFQMMRVLALDGQRSAALAQYETCRRVLAEELGVEPSAKTRELYEQIRLGTLNLKAETRSVVLSAAVNNLPVQLTPFIGRELELADLGRLITDPECKCITLVGPGGIGKTRLALQAAANHLNEFAQGVAFVPLASVGSIGTVIPTIANAVNFSFYGSSDPKMQLLNYLREKQMLLILDNVEHFLIKEPLQENIAELLIEILQHAPGLKLLVTSREALNLQEEWLFEVQGLAYPEMEQTEGFDEFGAVTLFVQRARRTRPGFVLKAEDRIGVAHLCRLVEGMPLAIELAASWVRILSPGEIAKEIERSLDFLSASVRDLPERHRSMRVVFDHSWQMLSADEQQVLCRLSVFHGGFLRQAAEQVAGATLSILSTLVIRTLLRRTANGRYDLHELVKQYASSKQAADALEQQSVQEKYSNYYLGLLENRDAMLRSSRQREALVELTEEIDNLRAAWTWSAAHQNVTRLCQVSTTLWYLFELKNWFAEGEVTFRNAAEALQARALEREPGDEAYRVALNAMLAHWAYFILLSFRRGKGEEAYAALVLSSGFLRSCVDQRAAIYALWYLGIVCWTLGRFVEANESLQESLVKTREYGERWYEALVGEFIGIVAHEQGAYGEARGYLSEALAVIRQLGDTMVTAHMLYYLCRTTQALGEYAETEKLLRESLALAREIDYNFGGLALDGLGQVAHAQGSKDEARTLFSESYNLFKEIGDKQRMAQALNHLGLNSLALGDTNDAQDSFRVALRIAYEGGLMPSALDALSGLAALYANKEDSEGSLELAIYVLQHRASTQEAKNLATHLRAELESRLSQEEIEVAQQRAGSKSLDELVRQVQADM